VTDAMGKMFCVEICPVIFGEIVLI